MKDRDALAEPPLHVPAPRLAILDGAPEAILIPYEAFGQLGYGPGCAAVTSAEFPPGEEGLCRRGW